MAKQTVSAAWQQYDFDLSHGDLLASPNTFGK